MTCRRRDVFSLAAALLFALALPALAQQSTSAITGRAIDTSGGALPGVTVAIASPQMIGGARTAVTDNEGIYRFTLLPGGTYTVTFTIPGFNTLNVEGVILSAGATMTINGKLEVATLQETVTVTSQAPTIDLESSKVQVNWDQAKLDEIPYSPQLDRSRRAHSRPVCHVARRRRLELRDRVGSGRAHLRPRRRRRGQLRRDDLGLDLRRLRHLRGSADHHGGERRRLDESWSHDEPDREIRQQHVQGRGQYRLSERRHAVEEYFAGTARQGLRAGRQQVHVVEGFLRRSRRPDPEGQTLVLRESPRRLVWQLHPGLHPLVGSPARWSSTRSCRTRPRRSRTR